MVKTKEKRKPRSYKISDTFYNKAKKRAGREKTCLATMLETVVINYGNGEAVMLPAKS